MNDSNDSILQLPVSIISRSDLGRLFREVNALDNFLEAAAVREPGTSIKLPKTSRLLDEMVQVNKLNVLLEADRKRLQQFLESVRLEAPVLHMSFSADPSPLFAQRLITWLRQEMHPLVMLQIGLQPSIGAGTIVRTTNKYFDFSLRRRFYDSRDILIQRLNTALVSSSPVPDPAVSSQSIPQPVTQSIPTPVSVQSTEESA